MYYVYVIKLCDNSFYKGLTNNLNRRLFEHETGRVYSTKHKLPFKLIHVEICYSREEARKVEKYFKSGWGREIITEIDNNL